MLQWSAPMERRWGAHLPHIGLWAQRWIDHWVCEIVTHGQCDARPTVTFPAAEHHRPLAGTKLYCLVTETHWCEQLAQSCYPAMHRPGVEPATSRSQVQRPNHYTTETPHHHREGSERVTNMRMVRFRQYCMRFGRRKLDVYVVVTCKWTEITSIPVDSSKRILLHCKSTNSQMVHIREILRPYIE